MTNKRQSPPEDFKPTLKQKVHFEVCTASSFQGSSKAQYPMTCTFTSNSDLKKEKSMTL